MFNKLTMGARWVKVTLGIFIRGKNYKITNIFIEFLVDWIMVEIVTWLTKAQVEYFNEIS